jgi:hypothetical protein
MRSLLAWTVVVILPGSLTLAAAQPSAAENRTEGWVPATYKARVFFRIDADRTQRHRQFEAMVQRLETTAGFKKDKGLEGEDFFGDTITGTVPGKAAERMNADPRVRTVLLIPEGYELPPEADKPVLVRLHLVNNFGTRRQREIAAKTRKLLTDAKFQEAVGYDHRGQQLLLGWLPAGQVDAILNQKVQIELAAPGQPNGPDAAPAIVRINPVQRFEVLREPTGAEPPKEPGPETPSHDKVSPDLRKHVAGLQGDEANKPIRLEVVLRHPPGAGDATWQDALTLAGLAVDGQLGPLVCGQAAGSAVDALAALAEVSTVRLPQPSRTPVMPSFDSSKPAVDAEFIAVRRSATVPGSLAKLIRRHEPLRVAIVASDFRGHEALIGKQLPKHTVLLDLTGERSPDIATAPDLGDPKEIGWGTRLAVLFQATAPADEMFLVRIDPTSPYAVAEVLRCVTGGRWSSEAIASRDTELRQEKTRLDEQKLDVRVQRQLTLNNFGDDKDSKEAREKYRQRQAEVDQLERAFKARVDRYQAFRRATERLKGLSNVLIGLHWSDGQPRLAGERQGLRFLDPALLESAAVIQAVPRTSGQTWSGLFRDVDGDGAMEFAAVDHDNAAKAALNFLAWQPHARQAGKDQVAELPAKAVIQTTLQWREIHSLAWKTKTGEDIYRKPLSPFRIVVLRQRDPQGKALPSDTFDVVARSSGLPDRIENDSRTAVYELTLRFQVGDQPGRYAIRIEGVQPDSTLPAEAAKVPGAERWELHPRLHVEVVDPASRAAGRVILRASTPE